MRSGDQIISTFEETYPNIPRVIKPINLIHGVSVLLDQDGHDHRIAHFKSNQITNDNINATNV